MKTQNGITKLTSWLTQDISQVVKLRRKKLSLEKQIKIIQLMNNLFSSGFNLTEIIDFLERSQTADKRFVNQMRESLSEGASLFEILERLKFSSQTVTQVRLSEFHGNLEETLILVETHLRQLAKLRKKFVSVATYPLMLLIFLIGIMLGLKNYLLPQISTDSKGGIAQNIITNLPTIFLIIFVAVGLAALIGFVVARRKTGLANFRFLTSLPLLGTLFKLYLTAYFSREWGLLISQGLDFKKVLEVSSLHSGKIFREVNQNIQKSMRTGSGFSREIQAQGILMNELSLMTEYGELKDKLGKELTVYAEECWSLFFVRVDRLLGLIQPLVFLFVALAIVLIYAAMLMPIYQNINMKF